MQAGGRGIIRGDGTTRCLWLLGELRQADTRQLVTNIDDNIHEPSPSKRRRRWLCKHGRVRAFKRTRLQFLVNTPVHSWLF